MFYADDVILTIRQPEIALSEIIKCIEQFGSVSGYKVNFHESEIMSMGTHSKSKPFYIDHFRWVPQGLTYMGIRIPPRLSLLYSLNIKPLIAQVKNDSICWSALPVSF